jgi:hypothetical protein
VDAFGDAANHFEFEYEVSLQLKRPESVLYCRCWPIRMMA